MNGGSVLLPPKFMVPLCMRNQWHQTHPCSKETPPAHARWRYQVFRRIYSLRRMLRSARIDLYFRVELMAACHRLPIVAIGSYRLFCFAMGSRQLFYFAIGSRRLFCFAIGSHQLNIFAIGSQWWFFLYYWQPLVFFTMALTLVGPWSCGHPNRG